MMRGGGTDRMTSWVNNKKRKMFNVDSIVANREEQLPPSNEKTLRSSEKMQGNGSWGRSVGTGGILCRPKTSVRRASHFGPA